MLLPVLGIDGVMLSIGGKLDIGYTVPQGDAKTVSGQDS